MAKEISNTLKKKSVQEKENKSKLWHKIIVRHLPPTMTEEEFLKQTDPLPEYDSYYFASADWSLGTDATCRAYITVKNYDDIFAFRDRFDGYVFVNSRGNEYRAMVEFAPFQGLLKNKNRGSDFKVNTIENQPHYQAFLKKLQEEREALAKSGSGKLEFDLERPKVEITTTPLLQYLANRKNKRRDDGRKRATDKRRQKGEDQLKFHHQYLKQEKSRKDNLAIAGNGNSNGAYVGDNKLLEKEENGNGTLSKRRNNRRFERNRRRSVDYKKRIQEQHAKQQQIYFNDNTGNECNIDKNDSRHYHHDRTNKKQKDSERDHKESNTTNLDDNDLNTNKNDCNSVVRNFILQAAQIITTPAVMLSQSNNDKINCHGTNGRQHEQQVQNEKNSNSITDTSVVVKTNKDNNSENKQNKQESHVEKRIRNKDRPSIAIYQPKARLRMSETEDNYVATDKKEHSQQGKVQRYSECSRNSK